ncbi:hypothetical protein T484DRAFT_1864563, partial [Baffinella frigidus]
MGFAFTRVASLCTLLANVREMGFAFTRCMKLHHNSLNDSAAGPIAQLIRCQLDHPAAGPIAQLIRCQLDHP